MFKLENTIKLKSIFTAFGLSTLLATTLVASNDNRSIDGAVKYDSVKGKYGPYHLNTQDTKKTMIMVD